MCVCVCVAFRQTPKVTSHAGPLSTPVLSFNNVIHHTVVGWHSSFLPQTLPSSPPPPSFLLPLTSGSSPYPSTLHFLRRLLPLDRSPPPQRGASPSPPVLFFFFFLKCLSPPALQPSQSGERRSAPHGPVTLFRGTDRSLLPAYTAGKLRTCGGTRFRRVCVNVGRKVQVILTHDWETVKVENVFGRAWVGWG